MAQSQNAAKSGKQGYELTIDPQHHAQAFLFSSFSLAGALLADTPARIARFPIDELGQVGSERRELLVD